MDMNMERNKVVKFVNDHKKGFTIGGIALLSGIMTIVLGKKCFTTVSMAGATKTNRSTDIGVPGWNLGELAMCWKENGFINAIIDELTVADVGKLGEELLLIDGITPKTALSMVLGMPDNTVG